MEAKKRGRKTKYTPETVKKIIDALSTGNYIETACGYAGIHVDTFYEWLNNKAEFSDAVQKARSDAEMQAVLRIKKAEAGGQVASKKTVTFIKGGEVEKTVEEVSYTLPQWQASAWWLERSFPNRWGRQRQDINITIRKPPKPFEEMTDEELLAYERELSGTGE